MRFLRRAVFAKTASLILKLPGAVGIIILLSSVVLSATVVSTLTPVATTFQVTAQTEYIAGTTAHHEDSETLKTIWRLDGVTICAGPRKPSRPSREKLPEGRCDNTLFERYGFSGLLEISTPTDFVMERIERGPLKVSLLPKREGDPAGDAGPSIKIRNMMDPRSSAIDLQFPVYLRVENSGALAGLGKPPSFAVVASKLGIGQDLGLQSFSSRPLTRGGQVTVWGRSLSGGSSYAAKRIELSPGDKIVAPRPIGNTSAIVRVNDEAGIEILFRVEAKSLEVRGFFSEAQVVSLTFLDKVSNDRLMIALWSILGFALAIVIGWAETRQRGDGS